MTDTGTPPTYPPARPTNVLAILALIAAFVMPVAAIVLGIIAKQQIRRTGEGGEGLASAGFILGIVFSALIVLFVVGTFVVLAISGAFTLSMLNTMCSATPGSC